MKKLITNAVMTLALTGLSIHNSYAQTDVTSKYLTNAGFDTGFHYKKGESGNVAQEIRDVSGWTKDIEVDYTITGIYQFGTGKTFNGASVPANGYDGTSEGGGLALSTGWGSTLKYNQDVTLSDGKYAIVTVCYNSGTTSAGKNLAGWIPESGESIMSSQESFTVNKWSTDTVFFNVLGEQKGKIQIGLESISGSGSGSTAKIIVDFVKILSYGVDKSELNEALAEAVELYADGSGKDADKLKSAIDAAEEIANKADATMKEVVEVCDAVESAMMAYKLANSSEENPYDFTYMIANPSFETNGMEGWTTSGMQTQTNTNFSKKHGTTYIEKWVNRGSLVGDGYAEQTIEGLPNGTYQLKVAAQNIQQDTPLTGSESGAYIFADNSKTAVTKTAEYTLNFTILSGKATIGFKAEGATGNWIACDNFRLYCTGTDMEDITSALNAMIESAEKLAERKMQNAVLEDLNSAIEGVRSVIGNTDSEKVQEAVNTLDEAVKAAESSADAFDALQTSINNAKEIYGEGSGNGAEELKTAIETAEAVAADLNSDNTVLQEATMNMDKAVFAYQLANASGDVPSVTTRKDYARGATMIFGRSEIEGVNMSEIMEHGLCWSTSPEPTVLDNRSTKYYSHNGYIYCIDNLKPSTIYYVRAYAITKRYAVGYGDCIKVITIPMGTATYQLNSSVTSAPEHHERIKKAMESAVGYWNNLTSIQGKKLSVNYNAGTPTAEASYSGYMQFGANSSYQQTGTALHEMNHTVGVGQHSIWYGPNSVLRENGTSGKWLGERANNVIQFLENNEEVCVTGDKTHMWGTGASNIISYGINGAFEDTKSELQYIGNALITQALGEDGLPPTGGFATPAYTFEQEDDTKYYIKSESDSYGFSTSYLRENADGQLEWATASGAEAVADDSCAWYISFNPTNSYYSLRNAATGKYMTYRTTGTYGITLKEAEAPGNNEYFQLMGGRTEKEISSGDYTFKGKGYWIVRPESKLTPPCLAATNSGRTMVATFNLADNAESQRWILMTGEETELLDEAASSLILTDLSVNGKTLPGFTSDRTEYTYSVNPEGKPEDYVVDAEKYSMYEGSINIEQAASIPGTAKVTAIGAGGSTDKVYTISFVKNYAYGWDGNGATGTGSEPSKFGWSSTPSVTWNTANSSANRYMDPGNGEYNGYTFDGNAYDQNRILWIRFNNSEEFRYTFDGLQAGSKYELSMKYGWHNNGAAPNLTVGVYEKSTSTKLGEEVFKSSTTKRTLKESSYEFTVPNELEGNGEFYISIKNDANGDAMAIIADLAVIDTDETGTSIDGIEDNSNGEGISIIPEDGGITIAADNKTSVKAVKIYSVTGIVVRTVNLNGSSKFVPLEAGLYIVGGKTVAVK